ncbi:MAG: tetratricopeptide repeat protein, partial [Tepidisphaeraceae bacterium]
MVRSSPSKPASRVAAKPISAASRENSASKAPPRRSPPTPQQRLATWLVYAAVLVIVAAVHWPVLSAQAVIFDDGVYLFDNPVLMKPTWLNAGRVLAEVLRSSTIEGYYEPLTLHSLMLDVLQGGRGDNLRPFHRTSLILHLLNTLLVMLLLESLCRRPIIAALVGLLFAVHPLTVEPLAWVWERKTLLATVFVLLSLIAYVRYVQTLKRRTYGLALVAFVLALMSKPTVTPLPVLLVLLDLWPLRRLDRTALLEKTPFLAIALVFGIITVISTASTGLVKVDDGAGAALKPIYLIGFYASKIIWPEPLSSAYALPQPMSLANVAVLGRVMLAVGILGAIVASLRWTRAWLVTGAWLLAALLPTLGLVTYSWVVASDKYVYFPSIGLLIALAFLLSYAWQRLEQARGPRIAWAVLLIASLVPASLEIALTRRYLAAWQDTTRLCLHMLKVTPDSANVHTLLGSAYRNAGRAEDAIASYHAALRHDPTNAAAHIAYGALLGEQGRFDEAVAHLNEAALRGAPSAIASAQFLMARLLLGQGRELLAIQHLLEAIRLQPHLRGPRLELGHTYISSGRLDLAKEQFESVLKRNPDSRDKTNALVNLGIIADRQARPSEAIERFRAVLAIDPTEPRAHFQLGLIAQTT